MGNSSWLRISVLIVCQNWNYGNTCPSDSCYRQSTEQFMCSKLVMWPIQPIMFAWRQNSSRSVFALKYLFCLIMQNKHCLFLAHHNVSLRFHNCNLCNYFVYVVFLLCTAMSFGCGLSNAKISASVIGNEKHRYRPKKAYRSSSATNQVLICPSARRDSRNVKTFESGRYITFCTINWTSNPLTRVKNQLKSDTSKSTFTANFTMS